jgi:hypothetical protein
MTDITNPISINGIQTSIKKNFSHLRSDLSTKNSENSELLSFQESIIILKWISTIKPGEKLDTKHLQILSNTISVSLYRTFFSGETRNTTFQFINYVVNQAIKLIDKYLEEYNKNSIYKKQLSNLILALGLACDGIKNLKITYKDDRMFLCFIDSLIENVIVLKFNELSELSSELVDNDIIRKLIEVKRNDERERDKGIEEKRDDKKEEKKDERERDKGIDSDFEPEIDTEDEII